MRKFFQWLWSTLKEVGSFLWQKFMESLQAFEPPPEVCAAVDLPHKANVPEEFCCPEPGRLKKTWLFLSGGLDYCSTRVRSLLGRAPNPKHQPLTIDIPPFEGARCVELLSMNPKQVQSPKHKKTNSRRKRKR